MRKGKHIRLVWSSDGPQGPASRDEVIFDTNCAAHHDVVVDVIGTSMSPTLQPGDRLLVTDNREVRSDEARYFLVDLGPGLAVRRLRRVGGHIEVVPEGAPADGTRLDTVEVLGRVIAKLQSL